MNKQQQEWFEGSTHGQEESYGHYVDGTDSKEVRYVPTVQYVSVAVPSASNETDKSSASDIPDAVVYPTSKKSGKTKELYVTSQIHETRLALCFGSEDEEGDYFFWVPKSVVRGIDMDNESMRVMAFFTLRKVR